MAEGEDHRKHGQEGAHPAYFELADMGQMAGNLVAQQGLEQRNSVYKQARRTIRDQRRLQTLVAQRTVSSMV